MSKESGKITVLIGGKENKGRERIFLYIAIVITVCLLCVIGLDVFDFGHFYSMTNEDYSEYEVDSEVVEPVLYTMEYVEDMTNLESIISFRYVEDTLRVLTEDGISVYDLEGNIINTYTDYEINNYSNLEELSEDNLISINDVDDLWFDYMIATEYGNSMVYNTFPLNKEVSIELYGDVYYEVMTYNTVDKLSGLLSKVFGEYVIDAIMSSCVYFPDTNYIEHEGVLYAKEVGYNEVENVGEKYYSVYSLSEEKYILRVYVEKLDNDLITSVDMYDIPYELVEDTFVFTEFPIF